MKKTGAQRRDRLRARLRIRDGDGCNWCGVKLRFDGNRTSRLFATIDHLTKREHGGRLVLDNCVLACRPCNNERHDKGWTPTKWAAYR